MKGLGRSLRGMNFRLLMLIGIVATVFAVGSATMVYRHTHARALTDVRAAVDGLMDAATTTAAIGAYAADRNLLRETVQGLALNPLVAHVAVVSPSGEILAERDGGSEDGIVKAIPGPVQSEHVLHSPFDSQEPIGTLRVRADSSKAEAAASGEATEVLALLLGQMLVVAVLLCLAVNRSIAQPIVRLGRTLRAMNPGTGERLKIPARHTHDEIGAFIRGVNGLLQTGEQVLKGERKARVAKETLEIKYRGMFDSVGAGTFVLDLGGRLMDSNAALLEIVGLPKSTLAQLGTEDFIRQAFADPDRVRRIVHEASQRREAVSTELELRPRGRPVRWVHCLLSVRNLPGAPPLIDGLIVDISARKMAVAVAVSPVTVSA